MDRIDSYIQEAFAKFRDVPEIQAQKEEMADHLRDRIRDAIAGGKSEKEAFDSVTSTVGDSMSDLEQTLAEFLRPEFRNGERPKPKTKGIYINFYRYHRAMMLLFAQILFTLTIFAMFVKYLKINLLGLAMWVNLGMGVFIVYSIAAYMWNPYRIKRVSVSVWRLLSKFVFGVLVIFTGVLLFSLFLGMEYSDFDSAMGCLFCFLLFYLVFFIVFSTLGWFRQSRYMFAPDAKQDTPLAKWGLLLTTVFFVVLIIPVLFVLGHLIHRIHLEQQNPGQAYDMSSMGSMNAIPNSPASNLEEQLKDMQNRLKAATGEGIELPRDGFLMPILDDNPHPMDGMGGMNARGLTPANQQNFPPLRLKNGQATSLMINTGQRIWQVPGMRQDFQIQDSRHTFSNYPPRTGMGGGMGMVPEPKLRELSLDGDFPATDLTDMTVCARNFPFEDYKLGMIRAVAPEAVAADETFPVRIGLGNLDGKNAKLLLTVEYDETLEQEHIPSGSTLFLGFLAGLEYREFKLDMHAKNDGPHEIRLQLRNESGQVIAETTVTVEHLESMSAAGENL